MRPRLCHGIGIFHNEASRSQQNWREMPRGLPRGSLLGCYLRRVRQPGRHCFCQNAGDAVAISSSTFRFMQAFRSPCGAGRSCMAAASLSPTICSVFGFHLIARPSCCAMPESWQTVPVRWPTVAGQIVGLRVSIDPMKFARCSFDSYTCTSFACLSSVQQSHFPSCRPAGGS